MDRKRIAQVRLFRPSLAFLFLFTESCGLIEAALPLLLHAHQRDAVARDFDFIFTVDRTHVFLPPEIAYLCFAAETEVAPCDGDLSRTTIKRCYIPANKAVVLDGKNSLRQVRCVVRRSELL